MAATEVAPPLARRLRFIAETRRFLIFNYDVNATNQRDCMPMSSIALSPAAALTVPGSRSSVAAARGNRSRGSARRKSKWK